MRAKLLSKKIIVFPLALLAFWSSACNPPKKGPATRQVVSADGRFELTVPGAWKEEKTLNDSAEIQASHRGSEMYVVVLSEPKEDLDGMTLDSHSKLTQKSLVEGLKKVKISPATVLKVGELPALQYEIRGTLDHINIVYLHTTVESSRYFHQILAWTVPSHFSRNRETLQKVTERFRERAEASAP